MHSTGIGSQRQRGGEMLKMGIARAVDPLLEELLEIIAGNLLHHFSEVSSYHIPVAVALKPQLQQPFERQPKRHHQKKA